MADHEGTEIDMAERSKTRRQFGSIRQLPSGRWQARYVDPFGFPQVAETTFAKSSSAEDWLRRQQAKIERGEYVDPKAARVTFGEWTDRWLATTNNMRGSTLNQNESYLRNRILPTFGDVRLMSIDLLMIKGWVAEQTREVAPATVLKLAQILGKILDAAVDAQHLRSNPAKPAKRLGLPEIETLEQRFMTPSQIVDLTNKMHPRFQALVVLGAYGGLRPGELLDLQRRDVDLLHGTVDVRGTIAIVDNKLVHHPPKTKKGRRVVPIPPNVVAALEQHFEDYPTADLEAPVFAAPQGGYMRENNFHRRFWQRATIAAGLGAIVELEADNGDSVKRYEGLRPHDMRHTAVALWIHLGATPVEIAKRAGHSSVSVVLDRYGHLFPESGDRLNAELARVAAEAKATPDATVLPLVQAES